AACGFWGNGGFFLGGREKGRGHPPRAAVGLARRYALFFLSLRLPHEGFFPGESQRAIPEDLLGTLQRSPRRKLHDADRGRGKTARGRSLAAASEGPWK